MLTDFAGSWQRYQAWRRTVTGTHRRRIVVTLVTLEHEVVRDLTPLFIGGEVTVDVTREPSRVATLDLWDPSQSLAFEPDSPGSLPLHFNRMIRVGWSVYVPELEEWLTCPVFCGPITDFDREGVVAKVTCGGKELLALGQAGRHVTFPKKSNKVGVARRLLANAGESRFTFPDTDDVKGTLGDRLVVKVMDSWWPHAVKLATSLDRDLFYDARGSAVMRRSPGKPTFTFDDKTLASSVSVDRDPSGIRNRWVVVGGKPKGKKERVHADVRLPPKHDLSGRSLGRTVTQDGKTEIQPRWLMERVENSAFKTKAACVARAKKMRDASLRFPQNYTFDVLPIPHLEENDLVRVETDAGAFLVRMRTWTLPLGLEGAPVMSVGGLRRSSRPSKRIGKGRGRTHANPLNASGAQSSANQLGPGSGSRTSASPL